MSLAAPSKRASAADARLMVVQVAVESVKLPGSVVGQKSLSVYDHLGCGIRPNDGNQVTHRAGIKALEIHLVNFIG